MTETTLPTRRQLRELERARATHTPAPPTRTGSPTSASAEPKRSAVFEGVDGMRGLAIASVLLYHSGWSERGLFGVDVFFVVSGFLITLLMLKELQRTGRIRVGSFFGRRAKRLVPGLVVTLGAVLFLLWRIGSPDELQRGAQTTLASIAQVANWQQIMAGDAYWSATGQIAPLAQMWSLSVTEQFYIVWPFAVLGLWFLARRRLGGFIVAAVVLLGIAAAVAPVLFDGSNADRLYLGTDSRAVAFVAGAVAAALVTWARKRRLGWAGATPGIGARIGMSATSLAALAAVVGASVATSSYHEAWLYQGGLAAVAVAAAVLTGTLCFRANLLVPFFSLRPFAALGRVSYSVFLLHLPAYWVVQVATDGDIAPLWLFAIGGALTVAVALIVHFVITEPLRKASWKPAVAAVAMTLCGALLTAGAWFLPVQREAAALSTAMPVAATDATKGLRRGAAGGRPVVVTVGDSIAVDWANMLTDDGGDQFAVRDLGVGGCGLLGSAKVKTSTGYTNDDPNGTCANWAPNLEQALATDQPDFVVVHSAWDAAQQYVDGRWISACDPQWQELFAARIAEIVTMVAQSPTHPKVLLSTDRPSSPVVEDTATMQCFNDAVRTAVQQHPALVLLDWGAAICPDGRCRSTDAEGRPLLQSDGVHLTAAGMAFFAPWLERQLTLAQSS